MKKYAFLKSDRLVRVANSTYSANFVQIRGELFEISCTEPLSSYYPFSLELLLWGTIEKVPHKYPAVHPQG